MPKERGLKRRRDPMIAPVRGFCRSSDQMPTAARESIIFKRP